MTDSLLIQIKQYLPFSYERIIRDFIDKNSKTILDIGTGDGELMQYVNKEKRFEITGVDGYKPFLEAAKKTGAYKNILLKNAKDISFPGNAFDTVICSQVLEYLSKKDGNKLIKKCKNIARKQVIFAAYIGDCEHRSAEGNPLQTSRGSWNPRDLLQLGFKVYGQGFRKVYTEHGYHPRKITIISFPLMLFSYLLSPFIYNKPELATHMIGVYKKL